MVGRTPWSTAPRMLNTSPASQTMMKSRERPSAEPRRKFSITCGENTTTQQAIDMDLLPKVSMSTVPELLRRSTCPQMPLRASMFRFVP